MLIKKVYLKNFKNHENSKFEFTRGINLILGPNGAGKSSIFEAIGLALFDVKINGLNLNSHIRKGEKSAEIEIEFEGNDGLDYTVIRRLSGGSSSKYELRADEVKKSGREIIEEVSRLCGINLSKPSMIFTHIICGYQNKLTETFTSNRKEIFDEIFEVRMYYDIHDRLRSVMREYELKERDASIKVEDIQKHLEEDFPESLLEKLQNIDEEIKRLYTRKKELEKKKKESEERYQSLQEKKNNISRLSERIENLRNNLNRYKKELENHEKELFELQKIEKELKIHEANYIEYQSLLNKKERIEEKIRELREFNEKKQKTESDLLEVENKIKSNNFKITTYRNMIDEKQQKIEKNDETIEKTEATLEEYQKKLEEQTKTLQKFRKEKEALESQKKKKESFEKEYHLMKNKKEELLRKQSELEEKEIYLKELSNKIEILEKSEQILKDIERDIQKLRFRKDGLEGWLENVENGICPVLNKECSELLSMNSENIFKTISDIEKNIKDKINEKRKIEKDVETLNHLKTEKIEIIAKINSLKEDLKDMHKLLKEEEKLNDQLCKFSNLEEELEGLNRSISEFEKEIAKMNSSIKFHFEEINKIREENSKLEEEIVELRNSIENLEIENNEYLKKKNRIEEYLKDVKEKIVQLEKLEKEHDQISNSMKKLRESNEFYNRNAPRIEKIPEIEHKISELKEEIRKSEVETHQAEEKLSSINVEELDFDISSLKEYMKEIERELQSVLGQIGGKNEEKKTLEHNLKKRKKILQELENLKDEVKVLKKKKKLLKEYRENIKFMGNYIADTITKNVEKLATEYYRKITGKAETIKWVAQNSYEVYLNGKTYRMLSGGEQMSVAIALRLALAKFYSDTKLLILDEPTSNLDQERRQAFSNALDFMLGDLEQVFIVTHDETFKENAQNVISLG